MKTAVIGIGVIGNVHLGILLDMGITPVAICDVDESATAKYPQFKAYTDYMEMLDAEKPDVVHICTPHYLHAEMAIYALERDINVLCEKPLCVNREEIDAILKAEENSKAQLAVCFQNRYTPRNICVREYLKNKTVTSGFATVFWQRGADYYNLGTNELPAPSVEWLNLNFGLPPSIQKRVMRKSSSAFVGSTPNMKHSHTFRPFAAVR